MIVLVPMVMMVPASAAMVMLMVIMLPVVIVVTVIVVSVVVMIVRVGLCMGMGVRMAVTMMVMSMVVIAHMGAALGLEGALHRNSGAALSAYQFRDSRIVLDVEGVVRDLHETVLAAEVPGKPHETQWIFGLDLQQGLGRSLHLNEEAILKPERIAVVDGGFHVEVKQDLGSTVGLQPSMAAVAGFIVEGNRIDDTIDLHGGLADDGGGAGHGLVSAKDRWK